MKNVLSIIVWIFGIVLGIIGMVLTFFIASTFINTIPMLCIVSLIVGFLIIWSLGRVSQYIKLKKATNKVLSIVACTVLTIFVFLNAATVFNPLSGPITEATEPINTKYWDLETGSHIAIGIMKLMDRKNHIQYYFYMVDREHLQERWKESSSQSLLT